MYDFYSIMKSEVVSNKFTVDGLLFVEYKCPLSQDEVEIYSNYDYIVYILSGVKTWKTKDKSWKVGKGEALYVKKGATIIQQQFDEDFCMLGFFITDDIIKSTLEPIIKQIPIKVTNESLNFVIKKTVVDNQLDSFFQSVLGYFHSDKKPIDSILKLKTNELILNILNNPENSEIAAYLKDITLNEFPSLPSIMEANYCFNLSLDQYAQLCHRSKSSFKRDFRNHYNESPGKWIIERRLAKASKLLKNESESVSQIAYDCGFESPAHFSRTFKKKYGMTPTEFKSSI